MDIKESWLITRPIAHRGLFDNKSRPENSLAAFKAAIERNYPFELDVTLSKDLKVVVMHDPRLVRMTGADGYVKTTDLSDLKKLKLLNTNETIPTLEEVLECNKGKVPVLIEIKNSSSRNIGKLEQAVLGLIKKYPGEYAVQSFNPLSVEWFKKHAPELPRGILSCYFKLPHEREETGPLVRFVLKRMMFNKRVKPDFIGYDASVIPNRYLKRKAKHLPVLAYWVHSQADYMRIIKYIDNIIFDGFEPKI